VLNFKEVLGYNFVNNSMDELMNELEIRISNSHKTFIVTANPEILTYAHSNPSYERTLKRANYIIPDGAGIIMASKILGNSLQERLAGFDLMERLLHLSNQKKLSIYFLGAKPKVIKLAVENIKYKYPNINIAGYYHGYFKDGENKRIIATIKRKNPDIVLVGLGFPKQEKWISENSENFNKGIFIGLGGCFNVWAGVAKRAPKIWRDLNMEWLYRVFKQPSRAKRIIAIPIFLNRVFINKFKESVSIFTSYF
jgi:N-acetylglucosaminyldiphosphoundecaprenol N-acetyl-beta-D-mannosaminyltransferase